MIAEERDVRLEYNTVVFVSFENQFAPAGGLAAVMKMLPPAVSKYRKTILITPLFQNIEKTRNALDCGQIASTGLKAKVLYRGTYHPIEVFEAKLSRDENRYSILLVKANSFFLAGENPYIDTWRENALFNDAYFLCKSVPVVLELVKSTFPPPYVVHLQDWETALTVETMHYSLPNKCVLTLHNSYDYRLLNDPENRTVLQHTIPNMQGISTVSDQFSQELTSDVLQTDIFAPMLQDQLNLMHPVGINNGNFVELAFPADLTSTNEILSVKRRSREAFNETLQSRGDLAPLWGNKLNLLDGGDVPIFLLFGRDDPKQKGFDVAAASIYKLFKRKGTSVGYFIFAPIPGVNGLDGLAYLGDLCKEFGNNIMVFPFRLSAGYLELQRASSYVIMPSYYEPFGAANEGYANGVPVIARATGGLLQQVRPVNIGDLPEKTSSLVKKYHQGNLDRPTGFLYREHPNTETASNWEHLFGTDFKARRTIQEPVDRMNPVFWSMVVQLEAVLEKAVAYYKDDKDGYCRMIVNGIDLFKDFSWDKAARKYFDLLYKLPIS